MIVLYQNKLELMNKVRLFLIMFLICFVVKSQQYDVLVPWKLEGANERIDTYRKGKAKLLFVVDNSSSEPAQLDICLLYTSPSPRDGLLSRMPSSA